MTIRTQSPLREEAEMRKQAKWTLTVGICVTFVAGAWLAYSADEQPKVVGGVRTFMRMKLDASTKILEGLTTENFAMIRDGAQTLRNMSNAEKWRISNDALYRQYSQEFANHAEKLQEKANDRNLDGATLAWVECTMSCIRCHNHARAIKIAGH